MADILSLSKARKAKAKAAQGGRLRPRTARSSGGPRPKRPWDQARRDLVEKGIDAHKRDP